MPGSSQREALLGILRPIGVTSLSDGNPWPSGGRSFNVNLRINQVDTVNLRSTFVEVDGVVQDIWIRVDNLELFPELADVFRAYSLQAMLSTHGTPTRVLIGLQPPAEPNAPFIYATAPLPAFTTSPETAVCSSAANRKCLP